VIVLRKPDGRTVNRDWKTNASDQAALSDRDLDTLTPCFHSRGANNETETVRIALDLKNEV
jgi:hypothetical protein